MTCWDLSYLRGHQGHFLLKQEMGKFVCEQMRCRFVKLMRQPPDVAGHLSSGEIQVSGVHQANMLSVPEGIANNTKLSIAVVLLQGPELECVAWCRNSFSCAGVSNSHYLGWS